MLCCKLVPVYLCTFGKKCPYVSRCFGTLAASPVCARVRGGEVGFGGSGGGVGRMPRYVSFCARQRERQRELHVRCVWCGHVSESMMDEFGG